MDNTGKAGDFEGTVYDCPFCGFNIWLKGHVISNEMAIVGHLEVEEMIIVELSRERQVNTWAVLTPTMEIWVYASAALTPSLAVKEVAE